jgi:V/A-type H+-transporting ATPase subunit D
MLQSEVVPTRSAILQLREEKAIVHEAYDFLDEKRLLLAAELLRQLSHYEELLQQFETLRQQAEQSLAATIGRHGVQGTQVYPAGYLEFANLPIKKRKFMGVVLIESSLDLPGDMNPGHICHPSPEADHCRIVFIHLTQLSAVIAGVSGNLYRLFHEYRRTERRARALENVVIPEIEQTLQDMTTMLEEMDQEDVLRVHLRKE